MKTSQLMLYGEVFFSENHTKHTNSLCGQRVECLTLNLLERAEADWF